MVDNNPEIQRRLEELSPLLEQRLSEVRQVLGSPQVSNASKELMGPEYNQLRGVKKLAFYLFTGKNENGEPISPAQLLDEILSERYKGRGSLDPRPVPGRTSDLRGERVMGIGESY